MTRSIPLVATLALLLLAVIALIGGATQEAAAADSPIPNVHLLASSTERLSLEVVVPEPRQEHGLADVAGSEQIVLEGYVPGPEGLPVRDLLLGLPPSGTAKVIVEPLVPTRIVIGPAPVARVPRVVEETEGLALQAGWEPRPLEDMARALPLASLTDEGFFRGWRVARLRLAPMAYLGDGRWELATHYRVRVVFDNPDTTVVPAPLPGLSTLVEQTLVNGKEAVGWRTTAPPVLPTTVYDLPEVTWRIGITADGLYRLTYEALAKAKVPVAGADPDSFHLLWRGQEVAVQEVGTGDGTFDPGDALLFYGQKFHGSVQDEKYTDENVYWLTVDPATPSLRMASRPVAPDGSATPATWYTDTVRIEEDNLYWARWSEAPGTDATWFGERVVATQQKTRYYPIELTDLSSISYNARLQVEVAARNESYVNPDHHLQWSINDSPVGEDHWDGKVGRVKTLSFNSTLLEEGLNDIGMTLLTDVGPQDIYFNWGKVSFRRQTIAQDDQLALSAPFDGDAAYSLTGFGSKKLRLYDVSNPLAPVSLTGAEVNSAGATWNLEFADSGTAGQPYLALAEAEIQDVPALKRYEPRLDLLSSAKGADEIIIVPDEFYAAAMPLAEHRQAEGLRVEVVRVEDIYPLFNGGIFHPEAIRGFLAYAYEHWQPPAPAYILLVGDGHFNFKGHNPDAYGAMTPVYIPPYLDFIDPWQGEVAVDTRYGQVVGDDIFPDLAIGRLNANSAQDVEIAVTKIIGYEREDGPPEEAKLIFVADNIPDPGGDFEGVLNGLAADFVPNWMQKDKVYLTDFCGPPANPPTPCIEATQALTQTWSEGATMLTFAGHGAVYRWTHEPLLLNTQIDSLLAGHELPFVITLNCLDGYWMMPPDYPGDFNTRSMAEWMSMSADYGSIANFSPAGLGTTWSEEMIAQSVYGAIFDNDERRLGEIALAGQLTATGYPTHLSQVSTLFGDPGGWLRIAEPTRTYLPLVVR